MGKRKSKARVMKKAISTVPTIFDCIFCNHAKVVECKMNRVTNLGALKCRRCNTVFQMPIEHLHDPIDVYSEWIDATEKANRPRGLDEEDEAALAERELRRGDEEEGDELQRRRERRQEQQRAERRDVDEAEAVED